jgi:hypothetical protein
MTGVKFIVTRFVTQFVPAELKIIISYTVLKIIRAYEARRLSIGSGDKTFPPLNAGTHFGCDR